ncbi:MAG: histidinol-phosphate transaminase [Rhodospirillales bacterium]|jgi:histidinol-phosphate aminotransferase|nr:histidinol-phosphate transaminase [Rhodospirillaceae bacterium]MDP6429801.1 histidinol-phosphate transaminase [Rhodospirillales bacterium]MDP6642816.1 histidinol-phosphate transaminase [Rhodospirillales bacterium]MDP6841262.1 histidinol-phosphate transaminase [Rhodospirillales bacterium]
MASPKPIPGLIDITPYAGGESEIEGVERIIKLASNEGAFGPSPMVRAALQGSIGEYHRYPDGDCGKIRRAIADKYGFPMDNIMCGAGSDELIGLIARCYAAKGDEIICCAHGFAMYPIYARQVGADLVVAPETDITVDVDAVLARLTARTKVVFIANPNNPTGTYIPTAEVERLRAGLPGQVLLVLDSAYSEFVDRGDYTDGADLVAAGDNVVMLRTFSKIYGMGGLRLGWAYCPDLVADVINKVRSPFNVSYPAQIAGLAALEDDEFVARARAHNLEWRQWTTDQVRGLGLEVPDSVCNFVLVRFPDDAGRSAEDADQFLNSRGIITRRMAGYGLPDALRISIGLDDEMRAVVAALEEFTGRNSTE